MKTALLFLAAALLAPAAARADDVTDQIAEALASYKAGRYSAAATDLEFALQGIRQKQAEQLKSAFKDAPAGWEADEVETGAAMAGVMGGGISARRSYRKQGAGGEEGGDGPEVEVNVAGESPLLQAALMMMTNPAMAGAGAKAVKLGSSRGFLRMERGGSPEVSVVVANKLLVTIKGSSGATEADVMAISKAVDFAKLEKLAQP